MSNTNWSEANILENSSDPKITSSFPKIIGLDALEYFTVKIKDYINSLLGNKQDKTKHITYSELKSLRDNSELVPGMSYRITDYITTTVEEGSKTVNNQFDIIVTADDVNVLSHLAKAAKHEGVTYFDSCDIEAWQLWYDIYNDTEKYAWADSTNGKGVIYRMIDDKNNECPYDFKNILFYTDKYTENTTSDNYYYTFSYVVNNVLYDGTVESQVNNCRNNSMKEYLSSNKQRLNKNVFRNISFGNNCYSNTFGDNCNRITFGNGCYSNTFGNACSSNTFGNSCFNNKFGNNCNSNTFSEGCYSNTFGNACSSNTFGNKCYSNTFISYCESNTFENNCYLNTFGNFFKFNTFGNDCNSNTFGEWCDENTFGNACSSNTFENNCYLNTFGEYCSSNTFGNICYENTFGKAYNYNTFENNCCLNTFGEYCSSNTFGNYCSSNTFGNYCSYNTFGNYCGGNTFGTDKNNPKSYYKYIIFDNGNRKININCTATTSLTNFYQNIRIGLGVNNSDTIKTINDSNVGQTYETYYKPTNSQTITI